MKLKVLIGVSLAAAALFSAALYFGWIGYRSMEWNDFRSAYALSRFKEVHFKGRKVIATYRDDQETSPLIVDAPVAPLPEIDQKWFIVKAQKHGIILDFEK